MAPNSKAIRKIAGKQVLTRKEVQAVVKKARSSAGQGAKTPAAWRKGGKEWSRVLGRFGPSA